MKQILLPTDFSDNSWKAIQYAIQLFKDKPCVFSIINTYKTMTYTTGHILGHAEQIGLDEMNKATTIENLNALLGKISETFGDNPIHEFKTRALFDSFVPGIRALMSESKFDLIVMGTQGATGAKEVLFGSNTVHVLKEIKCPTLAIPSGFEYETLHEILFPTDLQVDYNAFQLDILKEIATDNNCNVNALHVSNDDLTDKQISNKLELEKYFKETSFIYHQVNNRNLLAAIDAFQINSNVHLLAMINNKHSFLEKLFFKSNIEQIGFHLVGPFLVIPEKR